MPKTLRGIFHNLKESKYAVSNNEIAFFFSSEFYLNKFMDGYKDNRKNFIKKLQKNMNGENLLNMDTLADIHFYRLVEKRGFCSWLKGVSISWEDLNRYVLRKMTEEQTPDWMRVERPKLEMRIKSMK